MIDDLIKLPACSMISIDNSVIKNMTSKQDFKIISNNNFEYESSRIATLEFNGQYALIAIEIQNDAQYFFCENYDEGKKYFNIKDNEFYSEIKLKLTNKPTFYEYVNDFVSDNEDQPMFGHYKSDDYYSNMIVKKYQDEIQALLGVEISDNDIVI